MRFVVQNTPVRCVGGGIGVVSRGGYYRAVTVEELTFFAGDGRPMRAWLALPEAASGDSPVPAVLVIHEIFGLVENIRPIVERLADNGFAAFAPDLYDKPGGRARCVARTIATMRSGRGEAMADLRAASDFVLGRDEVDEDKLGVVGFCMGGGFALLMGLEPKVRVSAPFYGSSPAYLDRIADSCPVVASFGGRDLMFRRPSRVLKKRLEASGIRHDLEIYPDAGHSFMTEPRPGIGGVLGAVGPLRVGYDPAAADDAWRRILAYFNELLR